MSARGALKKGFVIEQALLHHLQAITELPEDVLIPPRLIITGDSGQRVLERLDAKEQPNQAMQTLFDEPLDPAPGDSA